MNALEIRGLTKRFPGFTLDGLDLTLPCGCILGLIGENGAGKSTTIRLILNSLRADAGTIRVLDSDNTAITLKERIGVVLDEAGLPGALTAEEIGKVMRLMYRQWDQDAFEKYIRLLDIPCGKKFDEFSRGNRMKLGIAVAMSHDPELLILDEATSGLDPVVREQVVELLMDFTRQESHSVLISSHIVSDLEKLCDYIAFVHRGRLLLCEEKDVLTEQYGVVRCPAAQLARIDPAAILHRKETPYGAEALVLREAVPAGTEVKTLGIEELFIHMVKEAG